MIAWWRRLDRRGRLIVAAGHVLAAVVTAAVAWWWSSYAAQYFVQNVMPPSAWTIAGLVVSHLLHKRQADERHEDIRQHVTNTSGGNAGADHPAS